MAEKYKADAEKALKKMTIFGFGKTAKFEEAAAAYTSAGNAYKLSKDWNDAAEMYMKAAECQKETESPNDCCNSYIEAANSYKKTANPKLAVDPLLLAIDIYTEGHRLTQIARYYKEIAEIYEKERAIPEAIAYYDKAADINEADNKQQGKNQMKLKAAALCSLEDDFAKAAEIYEAAGYESLESKLGAYSAKGYLFQCVLCHMAAGDSVAARTKIDTFKSADHNFPSSRECQLLESLLEVYMTLFFFGAVCNGDCDIVVM